MRHRLFLALTVPIAAGGCSASDLLNPVSAAPAVVVTTSGDSVRIGITDTVTRSAALRVEFFTFGTCRTVDASRTDVRLVAADTVEILPYDREGSFPCGGDVRKLLRHIASVTLNTPGRTVIRVVGVREEPFGGERIPAVVERDVIVR